MREEPIPGLSSSPRVELQGSPTAMFDAATGKTTVVLDFLIRDENGNSVDPGTTTLRRLVDGRAADVESVPDFHDTKLSSDLRLGLVLDASYSMTTYQVPAFEPMKQAALDTQQSIRTEFASWNAGTFSSLVTWFQDQYVCAPSSASMPDNAVLDIPTPKPGDATKLLAAAADMVDRMSAIYQASSSPSASGHYAMVLFTDGWDNFSWHDDSTVPATSYVAAGGSFVCAGPGPMTLPDLVAKVRAFPQLKVHVIGLGTDIKAAELSAIAAAGGGALRVEPEQQPDLLTLRGGDARVHDRAPGRHHDAFAAR